MTENANILKPCPFCGGEAEMHIGRAEFNDVEIECTGCGATGGSFNVQWRSDYNNEEQNHNATSAIQHWNTRKEETT